MIGRLHGTLAERGLDHVLIDVGGVGYVVTVSDRVLAALPAMGSPVALHTDLLVREDLLQLFGFLSVQEREWHRLLMTVQGIGAKASMAILGAIGAEGVGRAIAMGDWSAVAAARGVGPKTAQRVVRELKDKAPALMAMGGDAKGAIEVGAVADPDAVVEAPAAAAPAPMSAGSQDGGAQAEALSALTNLGYGPGEAASAVARAAGETPGADTPGLIRAALRLLAPAS